MFPGSHLVELGQHRVVQTSVGRNRADAVWARLAVEVRERAACLPDKEVKRTEVPRLEVRFDRDVDGTLGHQAVRPEIAVGAYPPDLVGEVEETRSAVTPPGEVGEGQAGRGEVIDSGDGDTPLRIAEGGERAFAGARPPPTSERGGADDADDGGAVDEQGDQRAPHRNSADEVLRAVDRIEHPLPTTESGCATEFFAENRIVGSMRGDRRAQQLFG